jgi:hypothetical protein
MFRRTLLVAAISLLVLAVPASAAKIAAPPLQSPADDAAVEVIPPVAWGKVKRAATYEVQVAADRGFGSLVTGDPIDTANTVATLTKGVADGDYYWRVRGVGSSGKAGKWSTVRHIAKKWTTAPQLQAALGGVSLDYPSHPVVLKWSRVPGASKYQVRVGSDPSLARSVLSEPMVETTGSAFAVPSALAPGSYYWSVAPLDAQGHRGASSTVEHFISSWPASTTGQVTDLNATDRVFDPELSWTAVSGAASYEVEVSYSLDFAVGSRVCCTDLSIGTTVSPRDLLPNNTYYWRVRAIDVNGNSGPWSVGPEFRKAFDDVAPTVPGLVIRDNLASPAADTDSGQPGLDVEHPVVEWDPVPGASSYEVQLTAYDNGCDWTQRLYDAAHDGLTTSTAWAPKAYAPANQPGPDAWPGAKRADFRLLDGVSYCVRVLAIAGQDAVGNDIVSEWTQVGGLGNAAFRYQEQAPAATPTTNNPFMAASDYVTPPGGTITTRTPLLAWKRVAQASSYWVVIARDQSFTNVREVGFTHVAAYSPRTTLEDETTAYYWVVLPARNVDGSGVVAESPSQNSPQTFQKRSIAPSPQAPAEGSDVIGHPRLRWDAAEGAHHYRVQVASDSSFGDPIADISTAATSYTATTTYPVDTVLYWRVRAIDGSDRGLTWSATRTFRRRLPVPQLAGDNPSGGETIPVLSWSPVQGAKAYDMHVEQADGTTKDFQTGAVSFTPTGFYGTGVWRWQVRAVFPGSAGTGAFTPLTSYTRSIGAPSGAKAVRTKGRVLMSWDAAPMATSYRVQVSRTTSFRSPIDSIETDQTNWAPRLTAAEYKSGGKLYWRVSVIDAGHNVGAPASGVLTLERKLVIRWNDKLKRGERTLAFIHVTDAGGLAVKKIVVRVRGAGVNARRVIRKGDLAEVVVKPRRRGTVVVTATRKGYKAARKKLRVH